VNAFITLAANHGYIILFLTIGLESAGLLLPGETILLFCAFLARRGTLDIYLVVGIAALAAILGDNLGYAIARRGGRRLVARFGHRVFITPTRVAAAERFFARHGGKAVFLARWSAGLRVAGAWAAGLAHMPWRTFLLWNALGGIVWAVAVGALGYSLGAGYAAGAKYLGAAQAGVLAVVVMAGIVWYVRRHRHRRRERNVSAPT
jgi:membrane protein DedA with SNARE-associated domain